MDDMTITVSGTIADRAELTYKVVGERRIELTFLAPIEKKFDRAPVYLVIAGGGWHEERRADMLGMAGRSVDALRRAGFAVVSPDYRVTGEVSMRAVISDCMDAARYLVHFAEPLGIDRDRFVVSGHSAGGHLCLMMANAPHGEFAEDSPFDAVADDFKVIGATPMSPPTVLYDAATGAWPFNAEYARVFPNEPATHAHRHYLSPIDYITPCSVPTLLTYGTHDNLVYPENSLYYYDRCRAVGAPCEIEASHFGGHCFEEKIKGMSPIPGLAGMQDGITAFALRVLESSR